LRANKASIIHKYRLRQPLMKYDTNSENEGKDSNDLIFKGLEAKITPKAVIGVQMCRLMVHGIVWAKLFPTT
jgi:hypothetical protein